jgi:type IV pilus assembly protein PilM
MRSILTRFKTEWLRAGRPPAAVEITRRGVLAAYRSESEQMPSYAFQALPVDTVVPRIDEPNLRPPEVVAAAIRSALKQVSPLSRDITLVLPDSTTRVFILDFDTLPSNHSDILEIMRFRLRKVVPFDVENAEISYQVLPSRETKCRALVAIIPERVLAEYEDAVHAAGYESGAVLPSGLAGIAALTLPEPILIASVTETSLTTSIVCSNDVLLYRTHDIPEDPTLRHSELQRDIAVAAAYFEDQVMSPPKILHYAGAGTAHEFANSVDLQGLDIVDLSPPPPQSNSILPHNPGFAGVSGALAGAR